MTVCAANDTSRGGGIGIRAWLRTMSLWDGSSTLPRGSFVYLKGFVAFINYTLCGSIVGCSRKRSLPYGKHCIQLSPTALLIKMKKIYFSKNLGEVEIIIALLKENNYHPMESQISPHASIAGADIFYHVEISENEYERAKEFLKEQGFNNIL